MDSKDQFYRPTSFYLVFNAFVGAHDPNLAPNPHSNVIPMDGCEFLRSRMFGFGPIRPLYFGSNEPSITQAILLKLRHYASSLWTTPGNSKGR